MKIWAFSLLLRSSMSIISFRKSSKSKYKNEKWKMNRAKVENCQSVVVQRHFWLWRWFRYEQERMVILSWYEKTTKTLPPWMNWHTQQHQQQTTPHSHTLTNTCTQKKNSIVFKFLSRYQLIANFFVWYLLINLAGPCQHQTIHNSSERVVSLSEKWCRVIEILYRYFRLGKSSWPE